MTDYPHEDEPDGDRFLPHHYWLGLVLMGVGFAAWTGDTSLPGAAIAGVGFLIALDDYLSHAFGLWTPLDAAFKRALRNDRFQRAWIRLVNSYR